MSTPIFVPTKLCKGKIFILHCKHPRNTIWQHYPRDNWILLLKITSVDQLGINKATPHLLLFNIISVPICTSTFESVC